MDIKFSQSDIIWQAKAICKRCWREIQNENDEEYEYMA